LVFLIEEVDVFENLVDLAFDLILGSALEGAEEPQVLSRRQVLKEHVVLGTHAQLLSELGLLVQDVDVFH